MSDIKRVVLAYSGGLDTSVIAKSDLAIGYGRVASVEAKTTRREAALAGYGARPRS